MHEMKGVEDGMGDVCMYCKRPIEPCLQRSKSGWRHKQPWIYQPCGGKASPNPPETEAFVTPSAPAESAITVLRGNDVTDVPMSSAYWPIESATGDDIELELSQAVRLELFMSHECQGTYGDDGEMQCNVIPRIDFQRDFPSEILAKAAIHRLIRAAIPSAEPWSGVEMLDQIRASLAQAAELGTLVGVGGDIEVMKSVQILIDKAVRGKASPEMEQLPYDREVLWEKHCRLMEVIECDQRGAVNLMTKKAFYAALDHIEGKG